jgi:chitosanase
MITPLQKRTAQAMVNIFETGKAAGDYGRVTVVAGDAGHLTYGRSQTTLASGNLYLLIRNYCDCPGATLSRELSSYLDRLKALDFSLDNDMNLRMLLKEAGSDPVMHTAQDDFFDVAYWQPSVDAAEALGIQKALGVAVVYDSHVHGAWGRIRDLVNQQSGVLSAIGETVWITNFVDARKNYLLGRPDPLPRTIYRMDTFRGLIDENKWDLPLPFAVRGITLDQSIGDDMRPVPFSAEEGTERILHLVRPYLTGDDVTRLQRALNDKGFPNIPDGVYGPLTESLVRSFQSANGLTPDGIVGPATRSRLNL